MTESDWPSSYQIQLFVKEKGCIVTKNIYKDAVDIYNPKTEVLVSMTSKGKIPPQLAEKIYQKLGIKERP